MEIFLAIQSGKRVHTLKSTGIDDLFFAAPDSLVKKNLFFYIGITYLRTQKDQSQSYIQNLGF